MYALIMNGCDSVDIAEDINTLLAQYTDKEVKAVDHFGLYYEVYAKDELSWNDNFIPTGDFIVNAFYAER